MKNIIILGLFLAGNTLLGIVLKNHTSQKITILSFTDAQGKALQETPFDLSPCQVINTQNNSCYLSKVTLVTQVDAKKDAFIVTMTAKDLARISHGSLGLSLSVPKTAKILRKYYAAREKFPGQLNIRTQKITSLKKC